MEKNIAYWVPTTPLSEPEEQVRQRIAEMREFRKYLEDNGVRVRAADPDSIWVSDSRELARLVEEYEKRKPRVILGD